MEKIPSYGEHMTIGEFKLLIATGIFTDYDGHAVYATETEMSDIKVFPSDIAAGEGGQGAAFTHVVWFNTVSQL